MSCGMGHMCITMGTAEAIVIRMSVTANIFAISSRLWPNQAVLFIRIAAAFGCGDLMIQLCCNRVEFTLLRLESEVSSSSCTGGNRHFLSLGTGGLLPCRDCVTSGWHVANRVSALTVGGRVRPFHDRMPTVHPGMDVAFYFDKLGSFPALLDRRRSRGLRLIPRDITGHRVGVRVNVVGRLIAGGYLEFLIDVQRQHVWRIHTVLLIERRLHG